MPIIKSAKKRVKVARKATIRNAKTKRTLREAIKSFHASVKGGKSSAETHAKAQSALDTAAKKGILHKNKVARKKRQLAAKAKAAGTGAPAKKVAAKKAAAPKKVAAKKPAAKKAPAKKPVAKKTTKK